MYKVFNIIGLLSITVLVLAPIFAIALEIKNEVRRALSRDKKAASLIISLTFNTLFLIGFFLFLYEVYEWLGHYA